MYANSRRVRFCIEQPINSLFYHNVNVATLIELSGATRFISCMGGFGGETLKRLEFFTTMTKSEQLAVTKTPSDFKELQPEKTDESAALTRVTPRSENNTDGGWKRGGWVTGSGKRLKTSEQYPDGFCAALAGVVVANLNRSARESAR
eukprot:8446764-Pyramimonas_sp.AAC.1